MLELLVTCCTVSIVIV